MSIFRILLLSGMGKAMRVRLTPESLQYESKGGTRTLEVECGGAWRLSLSGPSSDMNKKKQSQ